MFQSVYSLRALFEKDILLAYQTSPRLWSLTGGPWVSWGPSCTPLRHGQAFPGWHQALFPLPPGLLWGSLQSCSCSTGAAGSCRSSCTALGPGGFSHSAGDAQQGWDSPASGALEDIPPLFSKQAMRGIWSRKGPVVEYLWHEVN